MCDFFGSHDDDQQQALMAAQTKALQTANDALAAQRQAQDQATAASDSASETNRLASESRIRKLLAAGPFGATLPTNYGDAQVATRQLFGGG